MSLIVDMEEVKLVRALVRQHFREQGAVDGIHIGVFQTPKNWFMCVAFIDADRVDVFPAEDEAHAVRAANKMATALRDAARENRPVRPRLLS